MSQLTSYAHLLRQVELSRNEFRDDVIAGLSCRKKTIPSKYFYDEIGSELFEQICGLPEYYPTRTELGILEKHAPEMAAALGPQCLVIEYGSGSSAKTRLLLDCMETPSAYVPVDVAGEQLRSSAASLAKKYPQMPVFPVCADFTQPFSLPEIATAERRVIYFPGSTIGNFTPSEATSLLEQAAELCGAGGAMLLGADLKKDPRILDDAYNDRQGVTAAFNLNLLTRINRELGGNFRVQDFWHHALYNPTEGRIEMHLVARRAHTVKVDTTRFDFTEGESICTEFSYKYSIHELRSLSEAAGFRLEQIWTDEREMFCVAYLTVVQS